MKKYFCVNNWVGRDPYYPHPVEDAFAPALVEINEDLDFNVGDQVFTGFELFEKLHEEAKKLLVRMSWEKILTYGCIATSKGYVGSSDSYLDIMFDGLQAIDHNPDDVFPEKTEKECLKFFFDEIYDYTEITVSKVVYDLEQNRKIFFLKFECFY